MHTLPFVRSGFHPRFALPTALLAGAALLVPAAAAAAPGPGRSGGHPGRPAAIATGDTRTVTRPHLPGLCAAVTAGLSARHRAFPAAEEAAPPDTARIQDALTRCVGTGGAVALVAGRHHRAFLSGPLTIGSGETLMIARGVTLFASRNPASYQIAGKSQCGTITAAGDGCSPFITIASHSAHNGVMGTGGHGDGRGRLGTIDGRGDLAMYGSSRTWWQLARDAESGGKQNNPRLLQANSGSDFTLYNVELANAAQFHVRFTGDGMTAWGVRIDAPATARNTDGIDPSGSNVTIRNSWIQAGDDGVAIKAGSSSATNMTIEYNHFYGTHGISIGSETNGGVADILVRDNTISGTDSHGNVSTFNNGLRIKSDPGRGGLVQRVTYEHTCMTGVQAPLAFTPFYATDQGTLIPQFTDIVVDGAVAVHSTPDAESQFFGFDATHPLGIALRNVQLDVPRSEAQYADVTVSGSNVVPSGPGVTVSTEPRHGRAPSCRFPAFPERSAR
jgi:polygalacturonase